MPNTKREVLTRLLNRVLRHADIGSHVEIDANGWASIEDVVAFFRLEKNRVGLWQSIKRRDLTDAAENDPQRFDVCDGKIRAKYGHSLPHVLVGRPDHAPPVLFHTTLNQSLPRIFREGLLPGRRTYVHLTSCLSYALALAKCRTEPLLLAVDTVRVSDEEIEFRRANQYIWITQSIPAAALTVLGQPFAMPLPERR